MEFFSEYAMFLAKAITIVLAIGAVILLMLMAAIKPKAGKGKLHFDDLSDEYQDLISGLQQELLDKKAFKQWQKSRKHEDEPKNRLFVIDFDGSIDAGEVASLREEVTAILAVAKPEDEVLFRLS